MINAPRSRQINPPRRIVFATLLAVLLAMPVHAGLKEGLAAYDRADYAAAQKELSPLAQKGDAQAQYKLGRMYSLGQGVSPDARTAAEWFLKSAEQGVAEAQGMLGYMYLVGEGAPQSNGKAYDWISKAAAQGDAMAQYNLAVMLGGKGAKEDPVAAARWMRKAAEQGHRYAQGKLADFYSAGKGVAKDLVLAYAIYGLSAQSGNSAALESQRALAAKLTPAQIDAAKALVSDWKTGTPLPKQSKASANTTHDKPQS